MLQQFTGCLQQLENSKTESSAVPSCNEHTRLEQGLSQHPKETFSPAQGSQLSLVSISFHMDRRAIYQLLVLYLDTTSEVHYILLRVEKQAFHSELKFSLDFQTLAFGLESSAFSMVGNNIEEIKFKAYKCCLPRNGMLTFIHISTSWQLRTVRGIIPSYFITCGHFPGGIMGFLEHLLIIWGQKESPGDLFICHSSSC